jgi:RRXRR protein
MKVFVLSKEHKPLMPTTPRRARLWLNAKRARVVCREPFTIQLRFATTAYTQPVTVGVDMGSQTVGVAAISLGAVAYQAEVALRTAIASKLTQRRAYRRNRRSRKTRYRAARFANRRRPAGWLPPFLTLQGRSYGQGGWLRCLNPACHPGACRSGRGGASTVGRAIPSCK